jgi:DUF4097 and DUF4098 domain-containing protein YvlB
MPNSKKISLPTDGHFETSKAPNRRNLMYRPTLLMAGALLFGLIPARLSAQAGDAHSCEARENNQDNRFTYAESRDQTLSPASLEKIQPSPNGGAVVHGWQKNTVLVRSCIHATGSSESDARSLASQITAVRGAGDIEPDGPKSDRQRHWDVSYEVWLPQQSNLDVSTVNGGVVVQQVQGEIRAQTVNGGVDLDRLAGDVKGSTVNGGLRVELTGDRWNGAGLHLSTTNGGIVVGLPASYSAAVETSTVNGGIHCDFPVTVQGKLGKHMSFQLGSGGAPIQASTVNGGIRFERRA